MSTQLWVDCRAILSPWPEKALIAALRKSNSSGATPAAASAIHEDALDGLRELLSWLEATAAKKRALVSFFY